MMDEQENIRLIDDYLHQSQINEFISLPQIAVMGDTSSGKSSLLSAISNIQFPSSDQITTRCPTKLHLSKSRDGTSSFEVDIVWHHSSKYRGRFEAKAYEGKGNFHLIPNLIAEAQTCILEASTRQVARDVITVRICDPDAYDLTLIDLPGFVRSIGKGEDASIVEDIRALCDEYLENKRCIVIAIIPANVDFHNVQIMADARKVDPETKRTIPVITKPDLIDKGAEHGVFELLQGKKTDEFILGFHIVKCRGQQALNSGITVESGIQEEERFFKGTDPWKSSQFHDQFGVINLKKKLADLQVIMLRESIPEIIKEIIIRKQEFQNILTKLGRDLSTDEQRREAFSSVIQSLESKIVDTLRGNEENTYRDKDGFTFRSKMEAAKKTFGHEILCSRLNKLDGNEKPRMGDNVTIKTEGGQLKGKVIGIRKDIYSITPTEAEQWRSFVALSLKKSLTPKQLMINSDTAASLNLQAITQHVEASYFNVTDVKVDNTAFIINMLKKNAMNVLPIFLNSDVFNSIFQSLMKEDWKLSADSLLNEIFNIIDTIVERSIKDSIPANMQQLSHWIQSNCTKMIKSLKENTITAIAKAFRNEMNPYSQNHYLFEIMNKKRNEKILEALNQIPTHAFTLQSVKAVITSNERMSCEDHVAYEMELALMAYGKVAGKRIIDQIPMIIEEEFLKAILKDLPACFKCTDAIIGQMLNEPKHIIAKKIKLREDIDRLTKAEENVKKILRLAY